MLIISILRSQLAWVKSDRHPHNGTSKSLQFVDMVKTTWVGFSWSGWWSMKCFPLIFWYCLYFEVLLYKRGSFVEGFALYSRKACRRIFVQSRTDFLIILHILYPKWKHFNDYLINIVMFNIQCVSLMRQMRELTMLLLCVRSRIDAILSPSVQRDAEMISTCNNNPTNSNAHEAQTFVWILRLFQLDSYPLPFTLAHILLPDLPSDHFFRIFHIKVFYLFFLLN
jgi:hypothetical protein